MVAAFARLIFLTDARLCAAEHHLPLAAVCLVGVCKTGSFAAHTTSLRRLAVDGGRVAAPMYALKAFTALPSARAPCLSSVPATSALLHGTLVSDVAVRSNIRVLQIPRSAQVLVLFPAPALLI